MREIRDATRLRQSQLNVKFEVIWIENNETRKIVASGIFLKISLVRKSGVRNFRCGQYQWRLQLFMATRARH